MYVFASGASADRPSRSAGIRLPQARDRLRTEPGFGSPVIPAAVNDQGAPGGDPEAEPEAVRDPLDIQVFGHEPLRDEQHPSKLSDLIMLTMAGGRERTEPEYATLLGAAGFVVDRTAMPPTGGYYAIEATLKTD